MSTDHEIRGPGRPRDQEATARILAAALELVISHGYDRVTTQMIARAAGVGKQTVYRRWPGKADLVLEALLARARSAVDEVLDETAGPADLETFLELTFEAVRTTAPALRGLMALAQSDEGFRRRFRNEFVEPRRRALARILAGMALVADGESDVTDAVMAIFGTMWYRLLLGEELNRAWAVRVARFVRRALGPG